MLLQEKRIDEGFSCFPTLWQAVIFRNYGIVSNVRLAEVLKTTPAIIRAAANDLGLEKMKFNRMWHKNGYITITKNNWNLLNFEQLKKLLNFTEEEIKLRIFENAGLSAIFKNYKRVERVVFSPLNEEQSRQTLKIRTLILSTVKNFKTDYFTFFKKLGKATYENKPENGVTAVEFVVNDIVYDFNEPIGDTELECFLKTFRQLYDFRPLVGKTVKLIKQNTLGFDEEEFNIEYDFSDIVITACTNVGLFRGLQFSAEVGSGGIIKETLHQKPKIKNRIIKGYFSPSGDVLYRGDAGYTENILHEYCLKGINGICVDANLSSLVPFRFDRSLSRGFTRRLRNLNTLILRAKTYGIKVFVRFNQPENLPLSFFDKNPELLSKNILGAEIKRASNSQTIQTTQLNSFIDAPESAILAFDKPQVKSYLYNAVKKLIKSCDGLGGVILSKIDKNTALRNNESMQIDDSSHELIGKIILKAVKACKCNTCFIDERLNCLENNLSDSLAVPYVPVLPLINKEIETLFSKRCDYIIINEICGGYPGKQLDLVKEMLLDGKFNFTNWIYDTSSGEGDRVILALEKFTAAFSELNSRNDFFNIMNCCTNEKFSLDSVSQLNKMLTIWKKGLDILGKTVAARMGGELYLCASAVYSRCMSQLNKFKIDDSRSKGINFDNFIESERKMIICLLELQSRWGAVGYSGQNHYLFTLNSLLEKLVNLEFIK